MNRPMYEPKGFKDVFDTELGQQIFNFLCDEHIFDLMRLATDFNRPAAEGIGDKLIEKFGEAVDNESNDRIKQFIGHVIKAVMKENGYELDKSSIPCSRKKELFSYASRYRKIPD